MKCKLCENDLPDIPMCFGAASPASLMVGEEEYESRVLENEDQCIVDDEHYFVRGHIELPVKDSDEPFIWSVWVSLSEASFQDMSSKWELNGRETTDPYFGWLCTKLPCYPDTLHLKTNVITQPVGCVPKIEIQESEHPLSSEQSGGIRMDRVNEIIHQVMCGGGC